MRGVSSRIGIAAMLAVSLPSGAAFGQVPGVDAWTFNPRALSASVSPARGQALTLACDVDALRIYMLSAAVAGPEGEPDVTARFEAGAEATELPMRWNGTFFASVERIPKRTPLVAAMATARTLSVSVTIDGADAGTFPLAGAGPALRGLVADCG
ncbi:hypothetical protein ACTZWW_02805 [Salinarimonas sp. NSM]|uniref:hypothetical protein n=1 Tax=Salinarimonas sp. NSM TaxID=3458003 RepID=UPI004035B825